MFLTLVAFKLFDVPKHIGINHLLHNWGFQSSVFYIFINSVERRAYLCTDYGWDLGGGKKD